MIKRSFADPALVIHRQLCGPVWPLEYHVPLYTSLDADINKKAKEFTPEPAFASLRSSPSPPLRRFQSVRLSPKNETHNFKINPTALKKSLRFAEDKNYLHKSDKTPTSQRITNGDLHRNHPKDEFDLETKTRDIIGGKFTDLKDKDLQDNVSDVSILCPVEQNSRCRRIDTPDQCDSVIPETETINESVPTNSLPIDARIENRAVEVLENSLPHKRRSNESTFLQSYKKYSAIRRSPSKSCNANTASDIKPLDSYRQERPDYLLKSDLQEQILLLVRYFTRISLNSCFNSAITFNTGLSKMNASVV